MQVQHLNERRQRPRPTASARLATRSLTVCLERRRLSVLLEDYELIAEQLSGLGGKVGQLENRVSDLLLRMRDVESVNARLEEAALTTAQALAEISGHWEAVYEAMRRKDRSQEAPER